MQQLPFIYVLSKNIQDKSKNKYIPLSIHYNAANAWHGLPPPLSSQPDNDFPNPAKRDRNAPNKQLLRIFKLPPVKFAKQHVECCTRRGYP